MEKEAISNFLGQYVKLKYHNDFALRGIILKIYTETILFKTDQSTSAIAISDVKSVVPLEELE